MNRILNLIDNLVNGITMYRLVLYYLLGLWLAAAVFSLLGMLPFSFFALLCSTLVIVVACALTNAIFARTFETPANVESPYITALILTFLITPPLPFEQAGLWFLIWASVWAMASKYIIAPQKKHIFNPAAFAVALTALTMHQAASWWVGTAVMLPFVVIGGIFITRKIQRFDLVLSYVGFALLTIILTSLSRNPLVTLEKTFADTALLFFAFVMLTEPLTTPPNRSLRIWYGAIAGILSAPAIHLWSLYSTPELALLAGNLFTWIVSPKGRFMLNLQEKIQCGGDICNFVFVPDRKLQFRPGQYIEWTLGHKNSDNRGNRRYFTIASSPTEEKVHLGVKFYPKSSTFKAKLVDMKPGEKVSVAQLAGDFVLPRDKKRKLVFIAGGIGITPFRSMMKYMVDTHDQRSVVLFYSNKIASEIAYRDVFEQAEKNNGAKVVYTLTDKEKIPQGWTGYKGYVDAEMIAREAPDYRERTFYISGPHGMVVAFEKVLQNMGVHSDHIKVDFFPGF